MVTQPWGWSSAKEDTLSRSQICLYPFHTYLLGSFWVSFWLKFQALNTMSTSYLDYMLTEQLNKIIWKVIWKYENSVWEKQ